MACIDRIWEWLAKGAKVRAEATGCQPHCLAAPSAQAHLPSQNRMWLGSIARIARSNRSITPAKILFVGSTGSLNTLYPATQVLFL